MNSPVLLGMVGPNQVVIILIIVVLLFGARKIPDLMKGVGQGINEFKKATKDEKKGEDKPNNSEESK
ncbi:MAG: twin-arginine translocase TatA/TatE family subunit [Flavobacteriales bacterium]|nr:twin-arginine translocase TatA/TatE family subunit [Flavobacteriales bacterium]MCB9449654.1 twin-arginine translocase TatA/TatE family subunit [Flavobacteriales bacterium]